MAGEYQSSEELQRHRANSVFVDPNAEKAATDTSQKDNIKKVLDKYINKHGSTVSVRKLAEEAERTNEYQMDLSADLVEILTKIKSELG